MGTPLGEWTAVTNLRLPRRQTRAQRVWGPPWRCSRSAVGPVPAENLPLCVVCGGLVCTLWYHSTGCTTLGRRHDSPRSWPLSRRGSGACGVEILGPCRTQRPCGRGRHAQLFQPLLAAVHNAQGEGSQVGVLLRTGRGSSPTRPRLHAGPAMPRSFSAVNGSSDTPWELPRGYLKRGPRRRAVFNPQG